MKNGVFSELN